MSLDISATIPVAILIFASAGNLESGGLLENSDFRTWCLIGAVIGGILSLAVYPPSNKVDAFVKWSIASLFAIVGTPFVISWKEWNPNSDVILAVSASLSAVSWLVINAIKSIKPADIKSFLLKMLNK